MILHGYWPWLDWISLAALAVWFFAAWWRNPEFRWDRKWIGIAAFLFALFWAIPWMWGEGSDLDIRVLPFLFVAILAMARVGRRAKILAAIPLLLFAARTVSVDAPFPGSAACAGRPRALVRCRAARRPRAAHRRRRRGPHRAALHPFLGLRSDPPRLVLPILDGRARRDSHADHPRFLHAGWILEPRATTKPPDWQQVQNDYDYVWAYDVSRFSGRSPRSANKSIRVRPARGLPHQKNFRCAFRWSDSHSGPKINYWWVPDSNLLN